MAKKTSDGAEPEKAAAETSVKVTTINPLRHNGAFHEAGSEIELPKSVAERLAAAGDVKVAA